MARIVEGIGGDKIIVAPFLTGTSQPRVSVRMPGIAGEDELNA